MKKICFLLAIILCFLCSCDASVNSEHNDTKDSQNVAGDTTTAVTGGENITTTAPVPSQTLTMDMLKSYVIVNMSYASDAGADLKDALRKPLGRYLTVKAADKAPVLNRIEISIDKTLKENTWDVSYADSVVVLRAYSTVGLETAINEFAKLLEQSPDATYTSGSTMAKGDYTVKHILDVESGNNKVAEIYASTDKDALSYRVGDEIIFRVSLQTKDSIVACDNFSWEAYTDDGNTYKGKTSGLSGEAEIKIPATGKGFVRLKCYAEDSKGRLIRAVEQSKDHNTAARPVFGAAVNLDEIGSEWGSNEPDDFDAFWAEQISVLDNVSPDLLDDIAVFDDKYASHDLYRVKINCNCSDTCDMVSAYITVPKNPAPGSLKINMYYNGYGTTDEFYGFNRLPFTNNDTIFVTVFAHSRELGHENSYYSDLNNYGFEGNEDPAKSYFRDMILRDIQALRFTEAYFGTKGVKDKNGVSTGGLGLWNGSVSVSGGSQGAFQAFAITALCPEVTFGGYDVPWMCDNAAVTYANGNQMGSIFRPTYVTGLGYFDTICFAKRIATTNQVNITVGLGDYVCPPSGIIALYRNLNCKVKLTFTQGRTHAFTPVGADQFILTK